MGCTSSTEIVTDPKTGQQVTKHRLGGAHPGNRRMAKPAYTPNPADFNKEGQATAHFVTYGGGNALVLQQGGIAQPQSGVPVGKKPEYIQGEFHAIFVMKLGSRGNTVQFLTCIFTFPL